VTFSIAGRCVRTGMFGVAISSSSPAVAARCAHVRARVGAVCTQNVTDPRLGPALLDLMAAGADARDATAQLTADPHIAYRQLTAVGRSGPPAVHSGAKVLGTYGSVEGDDAVAAGNLLAAPDVLAAMTETFADHPADILPERLLRALEMGLRVGGEAGPVRSAGLLVTGDVPWPVVDLRVDWHDDPIGDLRAVWGVYEPQMNDYVTRALDPGAAPSYGVPGDR
jgi:uncharacterized Ntn-hydrolase superfamily protein